MRARRVDANHNPIIAVFREAGFSVYDASAFGRGFPDCVLGYEGRSFLVEIKDGSRIPSERKLKPTQKRFADGWKGHYKVIETIEQALAWCNETKGVK
jgi:hypothetical protein